MVHIWYATCLQDEMLMFMEYCDEGTLESLATSTETGLPEELVRKYTRQLLEAVHALHERGIVHRDIKGEGHVFCCCLFVCLILTFSVMSDDNDLFFFL